MATLSEVIFDLRARTKNFKQGFQSAGKTVRGFENKMNRARNGIRNFNHTLNNGAQKAKMYSMAIVGITAAMGYMINRTLNTASSANELQNVLQQSFGSMSGEVNNWAEETGDAMNRAHQQMREFAAYNQAILKPTLGVNEQTKEMSQNMAALAVDMGSFFEKADKQAFEAIQSGLQGMVRPLRQFGIDLTQATLKSYALEKGIDADIEAMNQAEKQQLRYNYLMEKTTHIQGDAIRTSESYANQKKALRAEIINISETIGSGYLPIANQIIQALVEGTKKTRLWIEENSELASKFIVLSTGIMGLLAALGTFTTGLYIVLKAFAIFSSTITLLMSPMLFKIGILAGAALLLYTAWEENWGKIQDTTISVWNEIKPILTRIEDWEKRTIESTWKWVITQLDNLHWMKENFIPWLENTKETWERRIQWFIDLIQGWKKQLVEWKEKSIDWTIDLIQSWKNQITEWIEKSIEWTINLIQKWYKTVNNWVNKKTNWAINLIQSWYKLVVGWEQKATDWTVNLIQGWYKLVTGWNNKLTEWNINLIQEWYDTVDNWANKISDWYVNLVQSWSHEVDNWSKKISNWKVNLVQNWQNTVNNWEEKISDWDINFIQEWYKKVNDWDKKASNWTINLYRTWQNEIDNWYTKSVDWSVNLYQSWEDTVDNWAEQSINWAVNLYKGSIVELYEWFSYRLNWAIDLYEGSTDKIKNWFNNTLEWAVDLAEGTAEAVDHWTNEVVNWTVNLAESTVNRADKIVSWISDNVIGNQSNLQGVKWAMEIVKTTWKATGRISDWLKGTIEGEQTHSTQLDVEIGEVKSEGNQPWGQKLESIRQKITGWLENIQWMEIDEKQFKEMQKKLGEKASEQLKQMDGKFYRKDASIMVEITDLVLDFANTAMAFMVGVTAYKTMSALITALIATAGITGTLGIGTVLVKFAIAMKSGDWATFAGDLMAGIAAGALALTVASGGTALAIATVITIAGWGSDALNKIADMTEQFLEAIEPIFEVFAPLGDENLGFFEKLSETWQNIKGFKGIMNQTEEATQKTQELTNAQKLLQEALKQGADGKALQAIMGIGSWETRGYGGFAQRNPETNEVVRGDAGEYGIMQIMPKTGQDIHDRILGLEEPFDEKSLNNMETNIKYGVAYFLEQYKRYNGNVDKAISAYNAGRAIDHNEAYVQGVKDFWKNENEIEKVLKQGGKNAGEAWSEGLNEGIDNAEAINSTLRKYKDILVGQSPPPKGELSEVDEGGKNTGLSWVQGIKDGIDKGMPSISEGIKKVKKLFDNVKDNLPESIRTPMQVIIDFITNILEEVQNGLDGIEDLENKIQDLIDGKKPNDDGDGDTVSFISKLGSRLSTLLANINALTNFMSNWDWPALKDELVSGIKFAFKTIGIDLVEIGDWLIKKFKKVGNLLVDWLDKAREKEPEDRNIIEKGALLLEKSLGKLADKLGIVGELLGGGAGLATFIMTLLQETETFEYVLDILGSLFEKFVKILDIVLKPLKPLLDILGNIILQQLIHFIKPLAELISTVLAPVFKLLASVLQPIIPLIQALGQALKLGLLPIMWIFENIITPIFEAVGETLRKISNIFIKIYNWLGDKLDWIGLGWDRIPLLKPPGEEDDSWDDDNGNNENRRSAGTVTTHISGELRDQLMDLLRPVTALSQLPSYLEVVPKIPGILQRIAGINLEIRDKISQIPARTNSTTPQDFISGSVGNIINVYVSKISEGYSIDKMFSDLKRMLGKDAKIRRITKGE